MQSPIEQVENWVNSHKNASFLIRKLEEDDLDQVEMKIEKVSLGQQDFEDPDGYVSDHSILLHGYGSLPNGSPLPQNVFEIPLFGTWITQNRGDSMIIRTERATYTIESTLH